MLVAMDRGAGMGWKRAGALGILALAIALGYFAGVRRASPGPELAQGESLQDTATVLVAVRALARLESVEYHMERVIDLAQTQSRVFGMIQAQDQILLVAAGDVVAGVDLAKMGERDITLEPRERRVHIRLPAPEILSARLDNERTYVHTRKTDLLAQRADDIETRARQLAEDSIRQAALDAGILARAEQSARHTIGALAHSLGYDDVVITFTEL
jgi:hypothetical protein